MIIGFLSGRTLSVILTRSVIAFILFGILGYVAGWIIHWGVRPKLGFIDEENEEEGDNEDGEAMESL